MRYLALAFVFTFCRGYGSQFSCVDDPFYRIDSQVLSHWEKDLGRSTQPEHGIVFFRKGRAPMKGVFAECCCLCEGLVCPGAKVSDRTVKWVYALISTPNKSQSCLYRIIQVNERLKILRCQYPITEREQLREIPRWANDASFYEDYNCDTGFLVFEFVYEEIGDSLIQKYLRISADWLGIEEPIPTVHRAPECLKMKKIKREKLR